MNITRTDRKYPLIRYGWVTVERKAEFDFDGSTVLVDQVEYPLLTIYLKIGPVGGNIIDWVMFAMAIIALVMVDLPYLWGILFGAAIFVAADATVNLVSHLFGIKLTHHQINGDT